MTDLREVNRRLAEQDKKLDKIYTAVTGDESVGHKGLAPRMESMEKAQRRSWWYLGAATLGSGFIGGVSGPALSKTFFGKAIAWIVGVLS